ncbi:MAG: hypothetical protein KC620_01135 [Myxococcales bacterium]|nr:hypothetical protein [Myxococcales bacterium]
MIGALLVFAGLLGDVNVAGSVYLHHPTLFSDRVEVQGATLRGLNAEASFKVVADVTDRVSASAKVCYGCHDFTADMAYVDWYVEDRFNMRFGRFPVPFGEFYLRHDAANHRSATKPLPYEMGRMLRRGEYNLGVLPEPYPDNGVELYGTFRGELAELAYNVYAVSGFKGDAVTADLDFVRSRDVYYADNNRTPATGGRLTLAFPNLPVALWRWLAIGASFMYGRYDDEGDLAYWLAGIDFYTRIDQVNVRGEVMMRRTAIPDAPEQFRQRLRDLFVQREGFYGQLDGPIGRALEWLVRVDGFRRAGPTLIGAPLDDPDSGVLRGTAGLNIIPTGGVKLKLNYEYWRFSDFPIEHMLHTGLVGTF